MKTYKHTPKLKIENKIAIFETHAAAQRDTRRHVQKSMFQPIFWNDEGA